MTKTRHYDALVVGAGFGGLYQLYRLSELGLNVIVIDAAGDVGGTWYWSRYPGAMSDTESYAGDEFLVRYMVTALGLLSKTNYPAYPGINLFKGKLYHTGSWPSEHDFKDKRVGVIGNGSTGVQVITAIAKEVKSLLCFQRTPQYSVPSGDGPVSQQYREKINQNYDAIWHQVKNSAVAFGFEESTIPATAVTPEERGLVVSLHAMSSGGPLSLRPTTL